jgi:hypothetical protein
VNKSEKTNVSNSPIKPSKRPTRGAASSRVASTGSGTSPGVARLAGLPMPSGPALAALVLLALPAACIIPPEHAAAPPPVAARPRPPPPPATELQCSFKSDDGSDEEYHAYRLSGGSLLETPNNAAKSAGSGHRRVRFKIESDDGERIVATRTVRSPSGDRAAGVMVLTIDLRRHEATLKESAPDEVGERTLRGACAQAS